MRNRLIRTLKISGIAAGALILVIFLLPELFPGFVSKKIKNWANKSIEGQLNFSKARLSFIRHFPSLTLSLYDFSIMGAAPFKSDTLLAGDEIAFGLDLGSIFKPVITVNKFFLDKGIINVQVSSNGAANYNIFKTGGTTAPTNDTGSASLKIEQIVVSGSRLVYHDRSLPMLIDAKGFNYNGRGDLSKAIFDLASEINIRDFDLYYDGEAYVLSKEIKASLLTRINTSSLALKFEKNDLLINRLPVDFKGSFDFMKNGYALNFKLNSGNTALHDVFTILPPAYLKWLDKTAMTGTATLAASLEGNHIAATNTNPNLHVNIQVRNGTIRYREAPQTLHNLFLDLNAGMPGLNPDSLAINLDTLSFNIGKDYLHSSWHSTGVNPVRVNANLQGNIDLHKLDQSAGFETFDAGGIAVVSLAMNGVYSRGQNPKKIRADTIITSVPAFALNASISNGYFKYATLPGEIKNITLQLNSACSGGDYKKTSISLKNMYAVMAGSFIKGFCVVDNLENFPVDAGITASIKLEDLKKAIPLKDLRLAGDLVADIKANGTYETSGKKFPKINAALTLDKGSLQTSYYPRPIENIHFKANAYDETANLEGLHLTIEPLSFNFEGEPFALNASLQNFTDLIYNVTAKGVLDIGKIYRVFSQKGLDASGFIRTDIAMKGKQSDAAAGRYDRLSGSGSIQVKDLRLNDDAYPKPFYIEDATLRFNKDKIWLDNMLASYGSNNFTINGSVSNTIDYLLKKAALKGKIAVRSRNINVDEFMVFAGSSSAGEEKSAPAGVVLLPSGLSVEIIADADSVRYNGLLIKDLHGNILLDSGKLKLQQTSLHIADAMVSLNANYKSVNTGKAIFDLAVKADSFDIQKAYRQVKLFHDLASSASKASGIVSLDYTVKGNLNEAMMPDYPSLKGAGVLRLEKIKVRGLKLFSAMGKASGKDSINNPDLHKIVIKSSIANNVITIERVRMKVLGFRPRFEGQTTFDGRLNFKARLGLPPFGIIGIPMRIKGTAANPVIITRKTQDEDLEAAKEEEQE